jgi:hypothetical protein
MAEEQVPRAPGVMCGIEVLRLGRCRNPDIGIGALPEARRGASVFASPSAPDLNKINWRASLASCGPTVGLLLNVGPRLQQPSRVHRQVARDQPAPA